MKSLKRFITIFLSLTLGFSVCFAFVSCSTPGNKTNTATSTVPSSDNPDTSAHQTPDNTITENGTTQLAETDSQQPQPELPQTIRILAIGNSFSDDATEHLWMCLKKAGVKRVIIGNLHIGGCSLDTHLENMKSEEKAYQYRKNTTGSWSTIQQSLPYALQDEQWDYITMQQSSGVSGFSSSYGSLDELISLVKGKIPQNCKLYWHMTWAYQSDATLAAFDNYNKNQLKMYNAITDTVQSTILPNKNFSGVIAAGTALQNLRTSYIGDKVTRDGLHLDLGIGRYTVSLTWIAEILGVDVIDSISWCPSSMSKDDLPAVREAVKNAVNTPFTVTNSTYTQKP